MNNIRKPKLISPAGSLNKLKYAVIYGADGVYIGGKNFGLRAGANNFSIDDIKEAVAFAHDRNAEVYLTLNAVIFNSQIPELRNYVNEIKDLGLDAVIISDPGVLEIIKEEAPNLKIHLSTQTSTTNLSAIKFWEKQGIKRIVMAREVPIDELTEIRKSTNCEIEIFIHGAMCMSYSGRCALSEYMTNRDANQGDCSHPCRWEYKVVELTRPDQEFEVFEDDKGISIFSSKDLCLFDYIPQLIQSGIDAFKIEGRMKSEYYVAVITRAYRKAIDHYFSPDPKEDDLSSWRNELEKVSHREYTTGFTIPANESRQTYTKEGYVREYEYLGEVLEKTADGMNLVNIKNKILKAENVECIDSESNFNIEVKEIFNLKNISVDEIHPGQNAVIRFSKQLEPFTLLRR